MDLFKIILTAHGAAQERDKIKYRMNSGKKALIQSDPYFYLVNPTFGFDVYDSGAKKRIRINGEQAEIVKQMFDLYANKSFAVKDLKQWLASKGYNLSNSKILGMLHNRIYLGERYFGNELVGKIEPIIDEELFNKVAVMMDSNAVYKATTFTPSPLKGKIKCKCGASMMKRSNAYVCLDKRINKKPCSNHGISYSLVMDCVKLGINCIPRYNEEAEKAINALEFKIKTNAEETETLKRDIVSFTKQIDKLVTLVATSSVSSIYERKIEELDKSIKANEKRISDIVKENIKYNDDIASMRNDSYIRDFTDIEIAEIVRSKIEIIVWRSISKFKGYLEMRFKSGVVMIFFINSSTGKYEMLNDSYFFKGDELYQRTTKILPDFKWEDYDIQVKGAL
jgi:hypothetical protein